MRTWLKQKSIELLQESNEMFVALVINLLEDESSEQRFFKKLERILDNDTRSFIKALWRYIIFEELQLTYRFS